MWQWNCRGLVKKRAVIQQHIEHAARKPDVLLLQETLTEKPSLPGYRVHAGPSDGRGLCTLVRKGLTFVEHRLSNVRIEHTLTELIPTKQRKNSIFILNIYSNPSQRLQRFKAILHKASTTAGQSTLVACGDFNAMDPAWGYVKSNAKGRNLSHDAAELDYTLITDPALPTRMGNSVSRDTTPDLTFVKNNEPITITWRNTGMDLGSDHMIVEIVIPEQSSANVRKHTWIDWTAFRDNRNQEAEEETEIDDIETWTNKIIQDVQNSTKNIETDLETNTMDSRLAHLIEAKQSILNRWKKLRLNRRLRKKVAELNRTIEEYCRTLCAQQWDEICNAADGQMHNGKTWNLLRHLLDKTKTKSHQRDRLAKLIHREVTKHGAEHVTKRISDRYLPTTPTECHGPYGGLRNERLDRDIDVEEVRTALQDLNSKSAAGPDRITNKALKNLDDKSIESLTSYYNKCWKTGTLPTQWKKAKTILIPKPGKPPDTDNLRPISLTSCMGKVLEHVLLKRWQEYLEKEDLYPETIIGFRQHLSTQDAMIQLKHQIIDGNTSDNKAILGLDLQSAFDKVRHSAILCQVSKLNMGERSYKYIKDFLTDRTAELRAGDLQAQEKKLGSTGTPQGSVISPMLFNLVMIGVAERLGNIKEVRHTIYADDITLWVEGGSDAHIESTLQAAVDAIEDHLDGTGLRCSPSKSELLVYPPVKHRKPKSSPRNYEAIKVKSREGNEIPRVTKIRILGMTIETHGRNGDTVTRLIAKAANATRLLKRVTTKKSGMREESLIRLIHSFVICHVAYVAAYHKWKKSERNKINILIRRAFKTAMGLFETTSTNRLLQLGVHNTLEEIAEAQRNAQLERLSTTKAGRKILDNLGVGYQGRERTQLPIPDEIRNNIRVDSIPRNMHPEYNKGRRAARARALIDQHAADGHARYVDAAEYAKLHGFTTVVVDATGTVRTTASTRCTKAEQAEEVAIALAIADRDCHTVLCDSRQAVRNYAKSMISKEAVRILQSTKNDGGSKQVRIKWFPAHAGEASDRNANHNETAHAEARALTDRASTDWPLWFSTKDRMTDYNEITKAFRLARRTLPPPCSGLSREQAVLFRQLQTGSLPSPLLMHRMYPEAHPTDKCRVCRRETAGFAHMLWDCIKYPEESKSGSIPLRLEAAAGSDNQEQQLWAVQQVIGALARQGPSAQKTM